MRYKQLRLILGILASFIALTAIAGGIALLAGVENFPLEWLEGTPFSDFTIPAFILIFMVGGSSLVAAFMVFTRHQLAGTVAMVAGIIMMGEIVAELLLLNDKTPDPHWIQVFYFGLGLMVFGCGRSLWRDRRTVYSDP